LENTELGKSGVTAMGQEQSLEGTRVGRLRGKMTAPTPTSFGFPRVEEAKWPRL